MSASILPKFRLRRTICTHRLLCLHCLLRNYAQQKSANIKHYFLFFALSVVSTVTFYAFVVLSGFCKLKLVCFSLLPLVFSPSNTPAFRFTATSALPALALILVVWAEGGWFLPMARPGLNTEVFEVVFKEVFALLVPLLLRCLELILRGSTKQMKYSVPVHKVNIGTIRHQYWYNTIVAIAWELGILYFVAPESYIRTMATFQGIYPNIFLLTQCEVVRVFVETGCLGID